MERSSPQRASKILLAEDNPLDVRLILHALQREETWLTEVVVAEDGEEAIEYLTRREFSGTAWNPDLVILDLNLPKRDGTEVLQVIRTTEGLQALPVIVVSSSPEEISEGIVRQAKLEANGYIMKPASVDEFLALGAVFRNILMETPNAYCANRNNHQQEHRNDSTRSKQGSVSRCGDYGFSRSLVAQA